MHYDENTGAALDAALSRCGCTCDDRQKKLLLQHIDLLFEKNKQLNLTRITSIEDAIVRHIEDSLSIYKEFSHSSGEFCDIGTGGGFPGIPLGILSGRSGVLLDSVQKKARAVQEFIESMHMEEQLRSLPLRSEELASTHPNAYNTVVARAVSSLASLEELAAPLLVQGGRLLSMRAHETDEQRKQALRAADILGLDLINERTFTIGTDIEQQTRCLFVFKKVGEPEVSLPRRPGMAQKRPYGKVDKKSR